MIHTELGHRVALLPPAWGRLVRARFAPAQLQASHASRADTREELLGLAPVGLEILARQVRLNERRHANLLRCRTLNLRLTADR